MPSPNLDELARLIRRYGLVLCYDRDGARLAFRYPLLPAGVKRAIHNHRQALAGGMRAGRIELCPSPGLHRPYWRYIGARQQYQCEKCVELDKWQQGLWHAA